MDSSIAVVAAIVAAIAALMAAVIGGISVVAAAVLAGAGALGGTWLGNRLQSRSGLTQWRLQQRNHALLLFAERADAYLDTVTRYFAPPIAGQNVTYNQTLDAYFSLSGAGTLVQMQSPKPIRDAVETLMNHVGDNLVPATAPGAQVAQPAQLALLNTYVAKLAELVEVARSDFGEA